jgi:P-type E1-E2 ATPase
VLGVADKPRDTSVGSLAALRASGVKTIAMMTGDRRAVALRVGKILGLRPDEIHAEMPPQDEVRLVGEMTTTEKIAFVGDGVNDAAAFEEASLRQAVN